MMMINDLTLANEAVGDWSVTTDRKRQRRREAGELYHVRILMGHVYEALKLLQHIAADPEILDAVLACDRRTVETFQEAKEYALSPEFEMLKQLRDKAAFHFDRELPIRALQGVGGALPSGNEAPARQADYVYLCSIGQEGMDWHFELADDVVRWMIIRNIYRQGT